MFLSLYIFRNRLLTSCAFLLRLSYLKPIKEIVTLLSVFNDWKRSIFVFAIWLEVYSEFKLLVPTCNIISLRFKSRIFDLTWSYFSTTERKHFNKAFVANVPCKQKTVFTILSQIIKTVSFCLLSPWLSRLWVLEDVELPFILSFLFSRFAFNLRRTIFMDCINIIMIIDVAVMIIVIIPIIIFIFCLAFYSNLLNRRRRVIVLIIRGIIIAVISIVIKRINAIIVIDFIITIVNIVRCIVVI